MIPSPLILLVLSLAAWRTFRLLALDTLPPLIWLRDKAVGYRGVIYTHGEEKPLFRRERLADFLRCPYCAGFWASLAWYVAWLVWPHGVLYAAVPLGLNQAWAVAQSLLPD